MDKRSEVRAAIHDSGGFRGREDYKEAKMSVSAGGGLNETERVGMNDTEPMQ